MTRSDFMTLALAIVNTSGRPFVTTSTEQNKVCNRQLLSYAELTRCLYDDKIAFTLTPSVGTYDLRSTAIFGKRLAEPRQVMINGGTLVDLADQPGPITLQELERLDRNYQVATAEEPSRWLRINRTTLRLYPTPDQAYSNCFVSGYTLPADIDTSAAGDAVQIEIPDEHANDAAIWVAAGLMFPNNATETDFVRMQQLSQDAYARMRQMIDQAAMVTPFGIRGEVRNAPIRSLY